MRSDHRGSGRGGAPFWTGTAFHSRRGLFHLDVRGCGDGVVITSYPARVDGAEGLWQLRLLDEEDGRGLRAFGSSLAEGRPHVLGASPDALVCFVPGVPVRGAGGLVRQPAGAGPGELDRTAQAPLALWAEAGESLLGIVGGLSGARADPGWLVHCPGCDRPGYGPSPLQGRARRRRVVDLCGFCEDGTTLRTVWEHGIALPGHLRAFWSERGADGRAEPRG